MTATSYAELHAHSAYSFMDGASLPGELVQRAKEFGYEALALTDHDGVAGAMEFAHAAKAAGLTAVHGAEVTVRATPEPAIWGMGIGEPHVAGGAEITRGVALPPADSHLTLLVESREGWESLCTLLTRAHAHTRDHPQRQRTAPSVTLDEVAQHAAGLICLSGCAAHGIEDRQRLGILRDAFGADRLRIELQRPYARDDRTKIRQRRALAAQLGVETVVTGNVHAHDRRRAFLQDALVAAGRRLSLDASEVQRRGNHTHVMTDPKTMARRFQGLDDALAETGLLATRCGTFDLTRDLGYRYPGAEDPAMIGTLREACQQQMDARYPPGSRHAAEAVGRLETELRIIDRHGLAGFFVLHRDMLELAREVAAEVRGPSTARALMPPGRGRGSSVSSIVCYLTGLSHVDPIANDLLLGRFLNEELTAFPDIDLDFPRDIREVLIPRIHERYGKEHTALVATHPTFRTRGAVRELGVALGLPAAEVARVAQACDGWSIDGIEHDVDLALGTGASQRGRWQWLCRLARETQGLPRHLGQHPGGMIVGTHPISACCPIVPTAMEGRQVVQWDKDSCSDAGFLKIDLLGLGMLSCVERCVELIADQRGEQVDLSRIPMDDPDTFAAIQQADTTGVFQIESRAQMGSLLRTKPENLDDLVVQVAIVRPGPIVGGAVNPYIERRQRKRADPNFVVPMEHPSLREALEETLGTIIFQDQVLEVAQAFAGYTAGQAESLRRAMSRKRSAAALEAHQEEFVAGAKAKHADVTDELAQEIFRKILGFSGFGFPKAHSAAFAVLAYQSTWLRVHYGPEFLCSLLDEQPMGFYPPDTLVHEAQRRGITVLAPEVNASAVHCTLEPGGGVRIGLGYVMGVREADVTALVNERERGGRFTSASDLAARAGAGRAALEQLAWAGTCDALTGGDRRQALWQLGVATPAARAGAGAVQLALPLDLPVTPALKPIDRWRQMLADYATTGLTTGEHPVQLLRDRLRRRGVTPSSQLANVRHAQQVTVAGFVVARQRPATAKGITFMLLEDETGTVNLILHPKIAERHRMLVRAEPLLLASGRLERHPAAGGQINVVIDKLEAIGDGDLVPRRHTAEQIPLEAGLARRDEKQARRLPTPEEEEQQQRAIEEADAGDFKRVAPPVMSFAQGRRR